MAIDDAHFRIDLTSPVPRYYQIQQNITELIQTGILQDGDLLPPERALAQIYGVSRLTVRQTLDTLSRNGLVRSLQGVGTFVSKPEITQSVSKVTGFSERIRSIGKRPSSRVLGGEIIQAPAFIGRRLHIDPRARVIRLTRLRLADEEPLMLETSFLPAASFPYLLEENLNTQSLYDVLEQRYGVRVHKAEQTLEPTMLQPEEAEHLGLEKGQPAMLIQVTASSDDARVIEYSKSIIRGDRCRFYLQLTTREPILS